MMIKITSKCSMNCSHCMNDAKSTGKHMDFETFTDAIDFQNKYGFGYVMITGGEPFEHPQWCSFFEYAFRHVKNAVIEIATNGRYLQENHDIMAYYISSKASNPMNGLMMFQVCNDPNYYPYKLDRTLPVFNLPNVSFIDNVPNIYPQGRVKDMPHHAKGSKCCNIRMVVKQTNSDSLQENIAIMAAKEKVCTPHIDVDGNIKLGESDLCPVCSSIYKSEKEIMDDIWNFQCHKCDFINDKLDEKYKKILHAQRRE